MTESLSQIVDHVILTEHGRDDMIDSSDLKISGDTISFRLNKSEPFEDLEIGDDFVIDSVFVRYELEYRVVVLEIENAQARFAILQSKTSSLKMIKLLSKTSSRHLNTNTVATI